MHDSEALVKRNMKSWILRETKRINMSTSFTGHEKEPTNAGKATPETAEDIDKLRACVLDPDPDSLDIITERLESMGFAVLPIGQAIGASNQIRGFNPHLLVIDVNTPTIRGLRLIQILRRNLLYLPTTILYSDVEEDELAEIARLSAADDFMTKNENIEHFARAVERVMHRISDNRFGNMDHQNR